MIFEIKREGERELKYILKLCVPLLLLILVGISFNGLNVNAEEVTGNMEELAPANPDRNIEWEGKPYDTDLRQPETKMRTMSASNAAEPVIIDISHHQGTIDWTKFSKVVDLLIIRTQYGSQTEDRMHVSYENNAKKYGIPFGVYSYSLATDEKDAKIEARDFYNRASKDAAFYVIDVEEQTGETMASMRGIVNSYIAELRKLTDKKIGLYIANHMYESLNLDTSKADFVWIPRYGPTKPKYKHELWQYTERGRVDGVSTYVDLNRLANGITLDYFTKVESKVSYYTTNPVNIAVKANIYEYSTTTFTNSKRVRKVNKNELIRIVRVVKSSAGVPRLQLANGNYITANKDFVVKTTAALGDYHTVVPKKVIVNSGLYSYKSTNFTEANKVASQNKNTIFTIKDIDYTAAGTPRLKTVSGYYITANKSFIRKVNDNIMDYIYIHPKQVVTKSKVNVYTNIGFTKKTGKSYAKGKIITVQGISWSASGTPRLKIGTNQYISANLSYVRAK